MYALTLDDLWREVFATVLFVLSRIVALALVLRLYNIDVILSMLLLTLIARLFAHGKACTWSEHLRGVAYGILNLIMVAHCQLD